MTREEYGVTSSNHRQVMINQASLYLGDREAAAEIVDHAIEKSLKCCATITRQNYGKYMWVSVRNASLNYLELKRHELEVPIYTTDEGTPLQEPIVHTNDAERIDIMRAINALPRAWQPSPGAKRQWDLRGIAILLYAGDWTQVEVARSYEVTGMEMSRMVVELNKQLRRSLAAYAQGRDNEYSKVE